MADGCRPRYFEPWKCFILSLAGSLAFGLFILSLTKFSNPFKPDVDCQIADITNCINDTGQLGVHFADYHDRTKLIYLDTLSMNKILCTSICCRTEYIDSERMKCQYVNQTNPHLVKMMTYDMRNGQRGFFITGMGLLILAGILVFCGFLLCLQNCCCRRRLLAYREPSDYRILSV